MRPLLFVARRNERHYSDEQEEVIVVGGMYVCIACLSVYEYDVEVGQHTMSEEKLSPSKNKNIITYYMHTYVSRQACDQVRMCLLVRPSNVCVCFEDLHV